MGIFILSNHLKFKTSYLPSLCAIIFIDREESILGDIRPSDLHNKMQDPTFSEEAQLIDVREPEEVYVY